MTSGKITIDDCVKYIPQTEQTRDIKPNRIMNDSLAKNKIKVFQKTKKNVLKHSGRMIWFR